MGHHGQCPYKRIKGSDYCVRHGGHKQVIKNEEESKRQYNVAKWRARIDHFSEHQGVKTLREEIGIARLMLEALLQTCKDEMDLVLYSQKISELVGRIEKLVVSCSRLESSMGMLLDKAQAMQMAGRIINVISEHVQDPEALNSIADAITNEFSDSSNT